MNRETLTRIVLEVVHSRATGFSGDLGLSTPLGPEGVGIDSIGCLDIVLELEDQTGIAIRDETLTAEALATPGSLVEHLVVLSGKSHG